MGTIVVGYVATPEGRVALTAALAEAKLREASLIVVNSSKGGASLSGDDAVEIDEEMSEVHAELHDSGVTHEIRTLVRGNDPATDLIGVASESNADLIVIGVRRRTPVGKLIMGSNAQQILLDADCPVLAVKVPPG
jgi:nucleotide-binding universal stress UspA family protein